MTQNEFIAITKLINSYWNEDFDEFKLDTWFKLLGEFKFNGLYKTIEELAKKEKFAPKINQIIQEYKLLKYEQDENLLIKERNECSKLIDGQERCYLCDNTGYVKFGRNVNSIEYEYYARCVCPRGRDLNRFSHCQIDKRIPYVNKYTGKEENIYIPTIKEVLDEENFAILNAEANLKRINTSTNKNERRQLYEFK